MWGMYRIKWIRTCWLCKHKPNNIRKVYVSQVDTFNARPSALVLFFSKQSDWLKIPWNPRICFSWALTCSFNSFTNPVSTNLRFFFHKIFSLFLGVAKVFLKINSYILFLFSILISIENFYLSKKNLRKEFVDS